jgi:hypothetical protein
MRWFRKADPEAAGPLVKAVGAAALRCAEAIRGDIAERFAADSEKIATKSLEACHEFLAFFMHHVNRTGVRLLGSKRYADLQGLIGPIVVHSFVDGLVGHWPADMRQRIESETFEHLNMRELRYSSCTELFLDIQQDPFFNADQTLAEPRGVINALAVNIARQVFEEYFDLPLYLTIVDAVVQELTAHDWQALVTDAGDAV